MRLRLSRVSSGLRASLFILPIVASFVSGCAPKEQHFGGQRRPKIYRTIVSLSPSTTEIILGNSVPQGLKGRTEADNYPEMQVKQIPVVASLKPDYEKLQALKTDFVVADADLYSAGDIEKLKSIGAEVFLFKAATVDEFTKELYELSAKVGSETNFSSYIDKVIAAKNLASGDPITPTPKVAVILPGQGAEHYIAGTKTFIADVVKISGAQLVGPDSNKYVPMSPEMIVSQNPTVIILAAGKDSAQKAVDSVLNDARLKSTTAVKEKRIVVLDQDIVLRRGSRVDKLIESVHRYLAVKSR